MMQDKRKKHSLLLAGLILVLAISVMACGQLASAPSPAPTITITQAASTIPITPTVTAPPTPKTSIVSAQVTRVIDGDTIEVSIAGRTYTVRYIGIDTPETVHPSKPVEPFGIEASNKNKELVAGKTVRLEKDVSETDKYGRLLRYVYVGDLFVNAELLRLGYAQVTTYPPDVKYVDFFLKMQSEARENRRGLWAVPVPKLSPPSPSLAPSPTPSPTPKGHPSGATVLCRDGTYGFSQNRRGTCSWHGGVAQWLY